MTKEKSMNWKEKILAYSLKNAITYGGKSRVESVLSSLFHEGLKKEQVKEVIEQVKNTVNQVNKLNIKEQEKEYSKLKRLTDKRKGREGLPELPGAKKGKVIMRFSPSPSGPMHIGHALTGMPSALYVKKYKGKFILRIEDTNPENIYYPAYKMLQDEAKWLFGKISGISKISIQSDRMKIYYRYAEKLLKLGKAYVCTCSQKEIQKNRKLGRECSCRRIYSVREQLQRWRKMMDKKGYKEEQAVLRFKGDMQDKNPALRDFPLARINLKKHPRQKKKYRVWPLMNLAVTVDDIEEKVTHVIRAKDHRDNAVRQEMMFKELGITKIPWTAFLGRLHFSDLELSTTKFRKAIESGKFSGWDDKRLPTIVSLRKWGYKPEAFAKMAEQRGLSEVDKVISKKDFFDLLDRINKEINQKT